jgi:SAM-dependent methyltransferase
VSESTTKSETLKPDVDVREVVREKYGAIASGQAVGCCSAGCGCNGGDVDQILDTIGYTSDQAQAIPPEANLGLGCGNPLAFAELKVGDVVLDLGSGGGLDVFLAAREVGPHGRAIGVDMTPAMLERARGAAVKHGYRNVDFRLGEIEHLPVADASVDLVISNCVVNLSPDKAQVFRETFRALKPGGKLMVSDLVLRSELGPEMQRSVDLYVGCVAGAALRDEYLRLIRAAGFTDVQVVKEGAYDVGLSSLPADSPERAAFDAVLSVTVRARKP